MNLADQLHPMFYEEQNSTHAYQYGFSSVDAFFPKIENKKQIKNEYQVLNVQWDAIHIDHPYRHIAITR